jgi:hypothetical protein
MCHEAGFPEKLLSIYFGKLVISFLTSLACIPWAIHLRDNCFNVRDEGCLAMFPADFGFLRSLAVTIGCTHYFGLRIKGAEWLCNRLPPANRHGSLQVVRDQLRRDSLSVLS